MISYYFLFLIPLIIIFSHYFPQFMLNSFVELLHPWILMSNSHILYILLYLLFIVVKVLLINLRTLFLFYGLDADKKSFYCSCLLNKSYNIFELFFLAITYLKFYFYFPLTLILSYLGTTINTYIRFVCWTKVSFFSFVIRFFSYYGLLDCIFNYGS
jgi:hypothetical protein